MSSFQQKDVSDNHRRGIVSTLELLDRTLATFDRWAEGGEVRSALYRERNGLSPQQREGVRQQVMAIRAVIAAIAEDLHLKTTERDIVHTIHATTLALQPLVIELGAKHLRGYGSAPDELNRYMDQRVSELLAELRRLAELFEDDDREETLESSP